MGLQKLLRHQDERNRVQTTRPWAKNLARLSAYRKAASSMSHTKSTSEAVVRWFEIVSVIASRTPVESGMRLGRRGRPSSGFLSSLSLRERFFLGIATRWRVCAC